MISATEFPGIGKRRGNHFRYLEYLAGWKSSTGKAFEGAMKVAAKALGLQIRQTFQIQADLMAMGLLNNTYKRLELSREYGFSVYGAIRGLAGEALSYFERVNAAKLAKKATRETLLREAARREAAHDRKAEARRQKRTEASAAHEKSHPTPERDRKSVV